MGKQDVVCSDEGVCCGEFCVAEEEERREGGEVSKNKNENFLPLLSALNCSL